jgi:hypothetical protein
MNLNALPVTLGPGAFSSRSTPSVPIGTVAFDRFGRKYRYVRAGAADLVVGNVIQSSAQNTAHQNLTPTATAAGAFAVTAALGASAAAADLYKNGYLYITTTPGLGLSYVIEQHDAIASSGTGTFNLAKDTPIQVALTTSSRVSLLRNPYDGVIQSPVTTLTGAVAGVAVYAITAAQYGWIGVNGEFPTLIAGTPGVGLAVVVPGTAAGCVVVDGAAAATLVVGAMMETGVDGRVQSVRWNLG